MPRRSPLSALAAVVTFGALAVAACRPAAPPVAAAGSTCEDRTRRAAHEVLAVVDANRVCIADSDCVAVGVASTCFDVCLRAVSTRGVEAVRDAEANVDSTVCATFKQDGCVSTPPPCLALPSPKCVKGQCG
jgi:hypothetical protein